MENAILFVERAPKIKNSVTGICCSFRSPNKTSVGSTCNGSLLSSKGPLWYWSTLRNAARFARYSAVTKTSSASSYFAQKSCSCSANLVADPQIESLQ